MIFRKWLIRTLNHALELLALAASGGGAANQSHFAGSAVHDPQHLSSHAKASPPNRGQAGHQRCRTSDGQANMNESSAKARRQRKSNRNFGKWPQAQAIADADKSFFSAILF